MKHSKMSKVMALVLCVMMLLSAIPMTAFASIANWDTENVVFEDTSFGTNGYYNVIYKKDYTLVPGAATETEMVINNATGTRRQVMHIIELDPSNPDVSILPGYYGIDKFAADPTNTAYHKAAGVTNVAEYYDTTLGYQVVGAMNTCLAYDCNAPYSWLVYNGEVLVDHKNGINDFHTGGCQTMLCVYKDADSGECSVELRTSEQGLRGDEWQAIGANFAMTVKNGVLVTSKEERTSESAARSMIGVKEDGTLVLVMNDGRGSNNSKGFCSYELGESMLALGCKWAFNCDGGGSSSFVTRRVGEEDLVCRCVPCDGAERPTIGSVIVVSNVAPTGELDTINIESDYDIFAPGTTYTFGTKAIDTHGYGMDMPVNVTWALSDNTFGTVENGKFVSNGKLGNVTVQVLSGGVVFGEKEIQIANPTTFSLTDVSTVLPYSTVEKPRSTTIPIIAKIGEANVFYDTTTITVASSVPEAGTLDGFVFTATTNESISGTKLTLTYVPTGATLTYDIVFGKGSEIVWDFEDGDLHGFLSQDDAFTWQKENGTNAAEQSAIWTGGNMSTCITEKTFISTKENGGQVHNGEKALGLTLDLTQVSFNEWVYANIYNVEGVKVLRDTANGNNATTLGMWVYIPYGFRTEENAGSMAFRFDLMAGADKDHLTRTNFDAKYNGKTVNSLTEADIPGNRWIYVSVSLAGYNYVRTQDPANGKDGFSPDLVRMYVKPSVAQTLTYYFDDVTIDYSSAVDDRVPPTISNPQYATADTNIAFDDGVVIKDISAAYTVTVSDDNSGIDASTAAIYIDGNKVATTKVVGNTMFCDAVSLGVGTHKVKFEIADNLGNYTTLTRTIVSEVEDHHMIYRTRIELSGHNDSGETPMPGSLYYIDVTSNYSDAGVGAVFTLDLNTANTWELDHIIKGAGVEYTYAVNPCKPNEVTFSMTSPTAKGTLLSIPVRVYNPLLTNGKSDSSTVTVSGKSFKAPLSVEMTSCTVFGSYGNYDKYSVAALDAVHKIERHEHTAHAIDDKAAELGVDGYTGRTYCDVCQSIVDFGETIPALVHTHVYELAEGEFVCECGEKFDYSTISGMFEVSGKYYYAIAGNLISGWQGVEDDLWYFSDTDFAAVDGETLISGKSYLFEDHKLVRGAWVNDGKGISYWWGDHISNTEWVEVEGYTYHFGADGYAATGYTPIAQGRQSTLYHFDDQGRLLNIVDDVQGIFATEDGDMYYISNGILLVAGLVEYDGYFYYFPGTYKALKNADRVIDEAGAHGYVVPGTYHFDENGHMVTTGMKNGPQDDGYFYLNGIRQSCYQLVKYEDAYYFIYDGHKIAKSCRVYLSAQFIEGTELVEGYYTFDADGKLEMKNGPQDDGYFYLNGIRQNCYQLVNYEGAYYFISDGHKIAKSCRVYLSAQFIKDTELVEGYYTFDADGKLEMKNGPQDDGYFYLNGIRQSCYQLVKYEDAYYFIYDGHKIAKSCRVYLSAQFIEGTELVEGYYTFDADGKLEMKNGPQADGYFYVNGVRQNCYQLVNYEGAYYFISDGHKIAKNCRVYLSAQFIEGTELVEGYYNFDADGKLVVLNGPQPDGYFYLNGIRQSCYKLIEFEGDYYFLNDGNKYTTGRRIYIYEHFINGLQFPDGTIIPEGYYSFSTEGKMAIPFSVEGVKNTRDIGGYVTVDGKKVRSKLIIRGAELDGVVYPESSITEKGVDTLVNDLGVKLEMDLRSELEGGRDTLGVSVLHKYYDGKSYSDIYTDEGKARMKEVFTDLANPDNYPIYMHCTYGTDRVGSVCYILEAILGYKEYDLVSEYSLSNWFYGYKRSLFNELPEGLANYNGATVSERAEAYLLDCGVTAEQIQSIRDIFLED